MDATSTGKQQQALHTAQKSTEKPGHSWSTHDRACTHCRERKIRCGREKPQCANCERDGVDCGYYPPGKRVNHIKLLCNNVGSLEDRLSNIEEVLTNLTTLFKAETIQSSLLTRSEPGIFDTENLSSVHNPANGFSRLSLMKSHIFRDQASHTDRYHGASSLFALCKEVSSFLLTEAQIDLHQFAKHTRDSPMAQNRISPKESMEDALGRMCLHAGIDEPCDSQMDYTPVSPPPKQILLMVILQFFEQADYGTDIFNQSSFMRHVERIYSQHPSPSDEVWAICFNAIILLVWGPESSSPGSGPFARSQLAQPSLAAVRSALGNPRVLMVPKLVNVQALAILSIVAQQYCSPGLASSTFAQACILAKIMGLHQPHIIKETPCAEEAEERFKIIRSLYLRDKCFLLLRGSICWLPTFDCTLDSAVVQCSPTELSYSPRIQLAALQEEVYRIFYSARSYQQPTGERRTDLARLDKQLSKWADIHEIFALDLPVRDADLKLQFFATRISAFRGSVEDNYACQVLDDARATCLLLLMAHGKFDQSMLTQFKALSLSRVKAKHSNQTAGFQPNKMSSSNKEATTGLEHPSRDAFPLKSYSLLESFSPSAFFSLVKNAIAPVSSVDSSQVEEDINLLEGVCACYQELDARYQGESYIHKVGGIFCDLLQITRFVRSHQRTQTPTTGAKAGGETSLLRGSPNLFGRMQPAADLPELSRASSYLAPSVSHEGFSAKVPLIRTPETATTDISPPLLTSLDTEYLSQWYDPLRPLPFSPLLQQSMSATGRKRQRLYEPDFVLEDTEQTSLSDFLNTAQSVPF